jgi:hypothetical protein
MEAQRTHIIGQHPSRDRLYLDGKPASRAAWDAAHFGRSIDCLHTVLRLDRRDGREIARHYHCIRGA